MRDMKNTSLFGSMGSRKASWYICPSIARRSARDVQISSREELLRLVVHGILHVLGYDHPEGAARTRSRMWKRQEAYVAALMGGRA